MSTQHPDNVHLPFFAENSQLGGEDEIQEAFYAFSHLGCDEQMWDCEGKEVDNFVVKKLLAKYPTYFHQNPLGEKIFLTPRLPNPAIEKTEAKILLETLESLPRSYDAAKTFFSRPAPAPIFEVILPMTTTANDLNRVYYYYKDFVSGKQHKKFNKNELTIAQWIGNFQPTTINVIPLFEDYERLLKSADILKEYLSDKTLSYQRVFLARSDPAANYGLISAVILNKIALNRLQQLAKKIKIPLYPIIGVGSAPFRGNLRPQTVKRIAQEYAGAHTFTIQSSFKYDHPPQEVQKAIEILKNRPQESPIEFDEERALKIIQHLSRAYQTQIVKLAPVINKIAPYIPQRRKRKLHVGLFGYARKMGKLALPRAITFVASLYSLGLPPEIIGLHALNKKDLIFIKKIYHNFELDLLDALPFLNPNSPFLTKEIHHGLKFLKLDFNPHTSHKEITEEIISSLKNSSPERLHELTNRAAHFRGFLG